MSSVVGAKRFGRLISWEITPVVARQFEVEARRDGAKLIEAEHMFSLALASDPDNMAAKLLKEFRLDHARLISALLEERRRTLAFAGMNTPARELVSATTADGQLTFGTSAKTALRRALHSSREGRPRRPRLRSIDLLFGILQAELGTVPRALAIAGVDRGALQEHEPPSTRAALNDEKQMLIHLLRTYLRPYVWPLLAVVALQLVGTMANLYLPSLNADIIDKGVAKGDTAYILSTGGWMLAVTLLQIVCSIAAVYFGARAAMAFGRDVRSAIFHKVGTFSGREVAQFGAPSLITRNTNDVQQVQMLVLMTCTLMVAAPIMCVGGGIMALRQDVGLSWLMLVSIPALVVAIGLIVVRMVPQFRLMQARIDTVNRVLREQLSGIRVVRAFVRERSEAERFAEANAALTLTALRVGRLMVLIFPTVMLILNASSVAVLWFGAARVNSGEMQIGALTAFLMYLMLILMSVMMATFMAIMIPRAAVSSDRIGEVLATDSSVVPPRDPVREVHTRAELELRGVEFRYPGAAEPVLRNISFRSGVGQTTAIIGSTGAGKTTLVSLIARLFDATSGTVLIDGVSVRDLDPEMLWSRVGLVPQKPYLFTGTVASNLRYGNPKATDADLWEALEVAQASDFVRAMTDGLESPIAQGGTNVSGGQRQRLAIARALVRRPEIFLFDDSFSALDLGTDARLRAALRPHTAQATVVIVSQRVSTITDADQIVVLDDGEIVGLGRHEELLETCPTYIEIVQSQLAAEPAA